MEITEFPQRRLKPRDAAQLIGLAEGTLRNMRLAGLGPVCYRTENGRYYYLLADVLKYMEETAGERIDPTVQHNADTVYANKKTA